MRRSQLKQKASKREMNFLRRSATLWFIVAIVGARVAMGIFFSITGPTLPTLAENVNSTVSKTSWVFAGRKNLYKKSYSRCHQLVKSGRCDLRRFTRGPMIITLKIVRTRTSKSEVLTQYFLTV